MRRTVPSLLLLLRSQEGRLGNKERLGILSSCRQGGATRTFRAVVMMRIAWRLPGVMCVRVFRSFGLMRVVAIVMVGCFCMDMIVPAQLLDAAI